MIEVGTTRELEDFPEYVIDESGTIVNINSGLIRKLSRTREGAIKVTLFRDGRPYTKSVALLVAKTWLYNDYDPDIFNTPIHLDNDPTNNHVNNLAWRPRWFAVKYQRQYWNEEYRFSRTRVQDTQTGEIYESLIDVCQKYGYLYMDVIRSCTRHEVVFPTWREFCFVD